MDKMTLKPLVNSRLRCDNGACRNTAQFIIERSDTARGKQLVLCADCVKRLKTLLKSIKID